MTSPKASGLLSNAQRPIKLARHDIPGPLRPYLEYFWSVHWQLVEGESFTSVNIPYPCAHIVYERHATGIFGPVKGSFEKQLSGQGFVLGARFKSGYFSAYSGIPAHLTTEKTWDLSYLFDTTSAQFEATMAADYRVETAIVHMSELLQSALPTANSNLLARAGQAYDIVHRIQHQHDIVRVEDLALQENISPRSLERLFKDTIGLTPKWVIRLFRLQQMADVMMNADNPHWADLALRLGYFDQAHCIKDFKAFTGKTPSAFL
ncbi:MAG: AraC family transcriptional regulator [Reinekea sp.]|nr:AraC family transcriptional regulator [Reinekea sp.]